MRYVQFGLLCEGSTDGATLPALVEKAIQSLLADDGVHAHFEWNIAAAGTASDVVIDKAVEAAEYDVVLAHRDGGGRPNEVRNAIRARGAVPLVPVREMEAWLIVDPAAFLRAARVPEDRLPHPLPRGRDAERVSDPKVVMQSIVDACFPRPRKGLRRGATEAVLELVAAQVTLTCLLELSAFKYFVEDLRVALGRMGWPFR